MTKLIIVAVGPPVSYNQGINLDNMTQAQAWGVLAIGIVFVVTFGSYAINFRGLSYKIPANGRQPGEIGFRARVLSLRVVASFFTLAGFFIFLKSLAVLV